MSEKKYIKKINILIFIIFSFFSVVIARIPDSEAESITENLSSVEYKENNKIYQYYCDSLGKVTYNSMVGYALATKEVDNNGNVIKESFFDQNDIPCKNSLGYFVVIKEYDKCNRNIKDTYYDMNGKLMLCNSGYACVKRIFNETSVSEFYYDELGNPTKAKYGQYGIRKYDFDELDRYTNFLYLDEAGVPMNCLYGYAGAKITYKSDGTIETVMYHDGLENPVKLSNGQYGTRYSDKDQISLNADGSEQIRIIELISKRPELMIIMSAFLICLLGGAFRKGQQIILLLYCGIILFLTFAQRGVHPDRNIILYFGDSYRCFFTSRATRITILENIWLFIPFGTGLYLICPKKQMIIVGVFFSIIIEALQLVTRLGIFETADIINNSIGTIIGVMIASSINRKNIE